MYCMYSRMAATILVLYWYGTVSCIILYDTVRYLQYGIINV